MKRSKHSLSNYKLTTFDMGKLTPVGMFEVIPGDSVRLSTSALIRVSPMVAPVMHPVMVRLHHWYVPYRLLWSDWEKFITGGNDGNGDDMGAFPTITAGGSGFTAGELLDHLGVPPGLASLEVTALPVYAYNLIFNEFYRDQDLMAARALTDETLASIAWEKDYFSSARPWTQRGDDIYLPITGQADVTFPTGVTSRGTAGYDAASAGNSQGNLTMDASGNLSFNSSSGAGQAWLQSTATPTDAYADMSTTTPLNINDLREAFGLQRYREARARYGARYSEYLRYYGIRPSDARLQRPEYLGGGKQTIAMSEVLRTGNGDTAEEAVGSMYGHGIAALKSRRLVKFFEEHGVVLTLASVRPRTMYANGLHKTWIRRTKEDFFTKELENIGQQEIQNQEIYANAATPTGVFGYQDRYADYRSIPSTIGGDFRSTLDHWHLARLLASEPTLNEAFVTCTPSKRIHAVQSDDVLWGMFSHSIQARRMVSKSPGGRSF